MARPVKASLDYYPHDTKDGRKMNRLVAAYGGLGSGMYHELLRSIYGGEFGYYRHCDEEDIEFMANHLRFDQQQAQASFKYMLKIGLYEPKLYEQHGILTSKEVQMRYLEIAFRRKEVVLVREYLLVDLQTEGQKFLLRGNIEFTSLYPGQHKKPHFHNNPINVYNNPDDGDTNPVNDSNSTQIKLNEIEGLKRGITRARNLENQFERSHYQTLVMPWWQDLCGGRYEPWQFNDFIPLFNTYGAYELMNAMLEFKRGGHRDFKLIARALNPADAFTWDYKEKQQEEIQQAKQQRQTAPSRGGRANETPAQRRLRETQMAAINRGKEGQS